MNKSYQELTKISREFRDLAGDLLRADTNTFDTALNFFKSFCEETKIIQTILTPILESEFDTQTWFDNAVNQQYSMAGSGDATLPTKKVDALKVVYDMLWSEDAQNTFLDFGFNTMYTKNFNEQLRKVNNNLTNLLIRYITRELEDEIEMIKPQSNQAWNQYNTYNGPTNVANNSSHFTQNVSINNPTLAEYVEQLRIVIDQSTELNPEEKQDALETVEMLEEELVKEQPSLTRVQKVLTHLPTVDAFTSIASNIVGTLAGS
ncbi:hypothetical protein [Bacillus sp. FJAT-52991]|uniref:Uncharacterized protein n=1 Tax=Bacillus kandeliae TaxID=3129297 RepID=A0ABZ2N2S2_9BACI